MIASKPVAVVVLAAVAGGTAALCAAEAVGSVLGACATRRRASRHGHQHRLLLPRRTARMLGGIGRVATSGPVLNRIAAAGNPVAVRDWVVLKLLVAALSGLAASLVGGGSPARVQLAGVIVTSGAGFLAPDFWLSRTSQKRIRAAVRELPDMLDLLRVTIDAGMAPARALGVVAGEFDGPLAREWRRVSAEVTLGVPQDRALMALGERLPAEEVRTFTQSLARASRHGVPLGRLLRAEAALAREGLRRRISARAAQAGPKIQLVVALLLVPAVLLLIAAVLLVELQRSGLFGPV